MRLDSGTDSGAAPTGNGDLGTNSNNSIDNDPGSHLVFRARSATFATMIFCLLWLAFEVMDLRRSFFHMGRAGTEKRYVSLSPFPFGDGLTWSPLARSPYTQWMYDVWANPLLFWR